jgi:hypothetical protein
VGDIKSIVKEFNNFYTSDKEKRVPDEVINSSYEERLYFWKGYYLADGSKTKNIRISNKGKLGTSGLYYIAKSIGYDVSTSVRGDKPNIFRLTCSLGKNKSSQRKDRTTIKKLYKIHENYTDYVYDVETEDGHFCAGIGELNIKNTDSTMVHVPSLNNDPTKAWEMAEIMEKKINGTKDKYDDEGNLIEKGEKGIFFYPLYLEFEKAMKILLLEKKNYIHTNYDADGNTIKEKNSDKEEINAKGIVLARRDNCLWVRETYEKMVRTIFARGTIEQVFDIVVDAITDVIELKFDITKNLSIVKSMGSNYKSTTFCLAIFSELMKGLMRPIAPGERFPYVIVEDHLKRDKIGQKMRTNEFFVEQWESAGLKYGEKVPEGFKPVDNIYPPERIDSSYYITNILSNPIDKLFSYSFSRIMEKYEGMKYEPKFNGRLKPVSVSNPVKMISLMIKDRKKEIAEHGIEVILDDIKDLKTWFRK